MCFQARLALRDSFRTKDQPEANVLIQLNEVHIRVISANVLWIAIAECSLIKRNSSSCNISAPYDNVNMCSHDKTPIFASAISNKDISSCNPFLQEVSLGMIVTLQQKLNIRH